MSLSPVEIAAYVIAACMSLSKLISACQVLWNKLPRWLAVLAPVLVAALPQVANLAGLIKTQSDLLTFCISAVALLLPGIAEAEVSPPPAA